MISSRKAIVTAAVLLATLLPVRAFAEDAAELSPRAHAAIERGLAFLAREQRLDGSWPGSWGGTTGVVSTCGLAFLAAGHVPGQGRYGANVARSVDFVVRSAQPDGLLYRHGMSGAAMYHHGLATLFLAEVWGMTGNIHIRDVLKRAVERIIASQNWKGGWRYHPRPADDDLSVTVMQLMALRAAHEAGVFVPKDVIDSGVSYVKSCHNPVERGRDAGFGYTPGRQSGFALTGAGVLSLQVAGEYRAREIRQGVDYILRHGPVGPADPGRWYYYGHYYAAQGIYQAQSVGEWGRLAWRRWYPAVTDELALRQSGTGEWRGNDHYGQYATSMSLLVLAIPFRYLPIYQR